MWALCIFAARGKNTAVRQTQLTQKGPAPAYKHWSLIEYLVTLQPQDELEQRWDTHAHTHTTRQNTP